MRNLIYASAIAMIACGCGKSGTHPAPSQGSAAKVVAPASDDIAVTSPVTPGPIGGPVDLEVLVVAAPDATRADGRRPDLVERAVAAAAKALPKRKVVPATPGDASMQGAPADQMHAQLGDATDGVFVIAHAEVPRRLHALPGEATADRAVEAITVRVRGPAEQRQQLLDDVVEARRAIAIAVDGWEVRNDASMKPAAAALPRHAAVDEVLDVSVHEGDGADTSTLTSTSMRRLGLPEIHIAGAAPEAEMRLVLTACQFLLAHPTVAPGSTLTGTPSDLQRWRSPEQVAPTTITLIVSRDAPTHDVEQLSLVFPGSRAGLGARIEAAASTISVLLPPQLR